MYLSAYRGSLLSAVGQFHLYIHHSFPVNYPFFVSRLHKVVNVYVKGDLRCCGMCYCSYLLTIFSVLRQFGVSLERAATPASTTQEPAPTTSSLTCQTDTGNSANGTRSGEDATPQGSHTAASKKKGQKPTGTDKASTTDTERSKTPAIPKRKGKRKRKEPETSDESDEDEGGSDSDNNSTTGAPPSNGAADEEEAEDDSKAPAQQLPTTETVYTGPPVDWRKITRSDIPEFLKMPKEKLNTFRAALREKLLDTYGITLDKQFTEFTSPEQEGMISVTIKHWRQSYPTHSRRLTKPYAQAMLRYLCKDKKRNGLAKLKREEIEKAREDGKEPPPKKPAGRPRKSSAAVAPTPKTTTGTNNETGSSKINPENGKAAGAGKGKTGGADKATNKKVYKSASRVNTADEACCDSELGINDQSTAGMYITTDVSLCSAAKDHRI